MRPSRLEGSALACDPVLTRITGMLSTGLFFSFFIWAGLMRWLSDLLDCVLVCLDLDCLDAPDWHAAMGIFISSKLPPMTGPTGTESGGTVIVWCVLLYCYRHSAPHSAQRSTAKVGRRSTVL